MINQHTALLRRASRWLPTEWWSCGWASTISMWRFKQSPPSQAMSCSSQTQVSNDLPAEIPDFQCVCIRLVVTMNSNACLQVRHLHNVLMSRLDNQSNQLEGCDAAPAIIDVFIN
jgi:hypothetical protein